MRIVFVTSGLARGGAEAQLIGLAREFVQRGHAVAIYTLNRELDRLPELDGSGVTVRIDQKHWKLDPGVLRRLVRFIREFRADIVQGFLYDGNFYGRLAARQAGVPALDSERSDNYRLNRFQRLGEAMSRHLARAVVANSRSGARFAQNLYGFPPDRVHTVWNGIDLAAVDRRVSDCSAHYKQEFFGAVDVSVAVLVGNIKPQKDYDLALDVAEELLTRAPDWRVLFLGDDIRESGPSYKQGIFARHASLPNRPGIVFGGRRPDAIEIVSQCDVMFSTSKNEGFPNVVLEAMTVGVPVVSTEYSDIRHILPLDYQVVSDRSPAHMVDALLRVYAGRDEVARLQRDWVGQNASIEASADALEQVFMEYLPK